MAAQDVTEEKQSDNKSENTKIVFHLTGFGKFCGVEDNPTTHLIKQLTEELPKSLPNGAVVDTLKVCHVSAKGSLAELKAIRAAHAKKYADSKEDIKVVYLHFGVNIDTETEMNLESRAVNCADFRCKDENGDDPRNQPIVKANGSIKHAYSCKFDLDSLVASLKDGKHAVRRTYDAGKFVCNWIYYHSLNATYRSPNEFSLFCHVPPFKHMNLEVQTRFAKDLTSAIVAQLSAESNVFSPKHLRFYLTGFGKFMGVADNPTTHIMKQLTPYLKDSLPANVKVESQKVLIVSGEGCRMGLMELRSLDDQNCKDCCSAAHKSIYIHFGVAAGRKNFNIENTAYNNADFGCADESNWTPKKQAIVVENGDISHELHCKLPVSSLVTTLSGEREYLVKESNNPGRFICNYMYYVSSNACTQASEYSLFVHVPTFKAISMDVQCCFARDLIREISDFISYPHMHKFTQLPNKDEKQLAAQLQKTNLTS